MNEKKRIENAAAEGFLSLYNNYFRTDFEIVELSEAPDVKCEDSKGKKLNLEITLAEDYSRDIQAALGRSNHRSLDALRENNRRVREGKEKPRFSSLSGNVLDQMVRCIEKKLQKNYGPTTALVVHDTSGVGWDWDQSKDELVCRLNLAMSPFDKGIWILNRDRTKLFQIIKGTA